MTRFSITLAAEQVRRLDLTPLEHLCRLPLAELLGQETELELQFDWPRSDDDPRELSEIPELRLWSLRADALWPWLPYVLERNSGQLARHVAMVLPHRFSPQEGIRFAPDVLELWLPHRLFLLDALARQQGLLCRRGLIQMAAMLGVEIEPAFWDQLDDG